ncbi:MAG: SpoIID/LytB domain-containing protein [Fibrobacter sp.]|nr:SpoIID/LytB domain-containing protein [Fibrobacter sp.]
MPVTNGQDSLQAPAPVDTSYIENSSDVDFGELIDSLNLAGESDSSTNAHSPETFSVKTDIVRVAVLQNVQTVTVLSDGVFRVKSSVTAQPLSCSRINFQYSKKSGADFVIGVSDKWTKEFVLPCTLTTGNSPWLLRCNNDPYRGILIIVSDGNGSFSVVNSLQMEEYLRGVVPLEIGKRTESFIEALKAQAVAARTYAYKKIQERTSFSYDMSNTVADQVYGGVKVEDRVTDLAVLATKDLIVVADDNIITAYYHSTCGGQTASIEQVWDKPACSYLVSVSDLDSMGQAYCVSSPAFTWQEKWSKSKLNEELLSALRKAYPQKTFSGAVKGIIIDDRLYCGRVKTCTIKGTHWSIQSGGDKIRFLFRRNSAGAPILRSSNFTISSFGAHDVIFNGVGYGHGVGMCQTGALGRALQHQSFDQILKAYYTGVSIRTAVPVRKYK